MTIEQVATERRTLSYDPALDGIRALAVGSVMVYHGFVGWGRGGFLGVDLFFVLSGYLITTLMLLEQTSTGTVSLTSFWYRRARRLLPALVVLLAWIAVYAAVFADPEQLGALRRDALTTLGYVANWGFIASNDSYFDQFSSPSPLRHMWSLAIEEQWYLLWPVVVGFGLKRRAATWGGWLIGLVVVAMASAGAMAVLASGVSDTSRAYYGTDTRVHALLVGAVVAFALHRHRDAEGVISFGGRRSTLLSILGLGGFIVMVIAVEDTQRWMYHGGFVLAALCGAALIIGTVTAHPRTPVRRFLSFGPLPLVGRMSYGLYLWHWPMYVLLTPDRTGLEGTSLFLLRVTVAFTTAGASYVLVERQVRRISVDRRRLAIGSVGVLGACGMALVLATTSGASPVTAIATDVAPQPRQDGAVTAALDVMVVGDSVAFSFAWDLPAELMSVHGVRIQNRGIVGCGVFEGTYRGESLDFSSADYDCDQRPAKWQEGLVASQPEFVVFMIGAYEIFDQEFEGTYYEFASPEYDDFARDQMDKNLDLVTAEGARAVLLTVHCMEPKSNGLSEPEAPERGDDDRRRHFNDLLDEIAAGRPDDVVLLDLAGFTCPSGDYSETLDGVKLYRDGVHFTPEGVALVWSWLAPQLQSIASES